MYITCEIVLYYGPKALKKQNKILLLLLMHNSNRMKKRIRKQSYAM